MASPVLNSRGVSEIQARWRVPLGLAPDDKANPVQWSGPCPRCSRPGKLSVRPGDRQPVIWRSHCPDHPDPDVYAVLRHLVPTAPPPSKASKEAPPVGELAAVTAAVVTLLENRKQFSPVALGLAVLEAHGLSPDKALDVLDVTATGNRSRARTERTKGLAAIKYGRKPARKPPKQRPAPTIETDSVPAIETDSRYSKESDLGGSVTSGNDGLTTRATLVLGPARNGYGDTGTVVDTGLALDLLRSALGAEVIATEPRPSPLPVADVVDAWMPADEGPCTRCGVRTCRYGDHGSPLCADCRPAQGEVEVPLRGVRVA